MPSKIKRMQARHKHQQQKRKARVIRVLNNYRGNRSWADDKPESFDALIKDLELLNVKYLKVLLEFLSCRTFGDTNIKLMQRVELIIIERTLLK